MLTSPWLEPSLVQSWSRLWKAKRNLDHDRALRMLGRDHEWVEVESCVGRGGEWLEISLADARRRVEAEPDQFAGYTLRRDDSATGAASKILLCRRADGFKTSSTTHTSFCYSHRLPRSNLFTDGTFGPAQSTKSIRNVSGGAVLLKGPDETSNAWKRGSAGSPAIRGYKRPGRGMGLCDDVWPGLVLFGEVSPHSIKQGHLGNCTFCSAISALAELPELIKARCTQQELALDGRYDVTLYNWQSKQWVTITVDDQLPMTEDDTLKGVRITTEAELWPCIYEKACAKLVGHYWGLVASKSGQWLQALTGASDDEMLYMYALEEDQPCGVWGVTEGFWPDGSASTVQKDTVQVARLLEVLDEQNCLLTCASRKLEDTAKMGLIALHGYSLLRVACNPANCGVNLLQLRNTWGEFEWNGAWSDGSKEWEAHPDVAEALEQEDGKDGAFWIECKDFERYFCAVTGVLSPTVREAKKALETKYVTERAKLTKGFKASATLIPCSMADGPNGLFKAHAENYLVPCADFVKAIQVETRPHRSCFYAQHTGRHPPSPLLLSYRPSRPSRASGAASVCTEARNITGRAIGC